MFSDPDTGAANKAAVLLFLGKMLLISSFEGFCQDILNVQLCAPCKHSKWGETLWSGGSCWLLIKTFLLEEGRKGSRAEGCQQLMGGPWELQGICWVHKLGFCLAVTSHSFCVQRVQNSNVLNLRIRVQTEVAVKHIIWIKVVKEQKWLRTKTFPESLQTNVCSLLRIYVSRHISRHLSLLIQQLTL